MKKKMNLILAVTLLLLPTACSSSTDSETLTPSATVENALAIVLDQTSTDQIQKMLDTLTSLQDDPLGFQVNYYQPGSNTLAFQNFYVRAEDVPQMENSAPTTVDAPSDGTMVTPSQKELVNTQMIDFNHQLLTILTDASYQPSNEKSDTANKVLHIFNVMDQPNNVCFDVYADGSITVIIDEKITHATVDQQVVETIDDLFEPLIHTYSGGQFHWVDDLAV